MGDKEYFLGLDMGTNSVGWAVTDKEYHLLRKKGKDLWGIREFEEAETSVNRRINRVSRRRRQREKVRIGLLREFFDEEIKKVDPYFFIRLDNSKYFLEDKDSEVKNKNAIFNDADYTDVEYYKQFPTIFHLRKKLLYSNEYYDIRLLYLAIANMFKRRGHFLNESLSADDDTRDIQEIFDEFFLLMDKRNDEFESKVNITTASGDAISEILGNNDISRKQKSEDLAILLGVAKGDKLAFEYIKCLCGLKCDAKKLFSNIETEDKVDICFKDFSYEDKIPELMEVLGDDNYSILEVMKQIYDAGILSGILKDANYLSDARVSEYEKHHNDLQILKKIFKKYKTQEEYDFMFRSGESGSYGAYVNSYNSDKKQRRSMGGNALRNSEVLYKKIKNMLVGIEDKDAVYILDEIENERFLPKQLTSMNGVIPNQLHKKELKRILANAEKQFSFLLNKDEGGRTVSDRILALFSFQIPYYIGPVSDNSQKNGGNGWVVRKEEGSVLPWNIEEKIDVAKTSEEFIMRMVRNCTYLRAEKVLPKMSLEYERFCVLNEINNIRIDGDKLSVNMKQNIYDDLFKRGKKVSRSSLEKYLIGKGAIESGSQITGIDVVINNALSSYGKFRSIFGEDIDLDSVKNMVERIIFLGTVYGDSKKMFRQSLEKEFSNVLSPEQLKRIIGYKFKDWGNLSKEFLELRGCNKDTGEEISLIRAMWESNNNMMELINSNDYTFNKSLEDKENAALKDLSDFTLEDLNDYYFSAPVKRMIWQTTLVIKEIKEVMGCEPKRIFIEMTRSDDEKGDKGRKDSRKKQFLDLYKNIKDELQDWNKLIEEADNSGRLRSKKMYLYLKQMGRDMYTGKPIDLDKLFNDNVYDIDHIYPRNFVKDDNLDNNLVLVDKGLNNRKQNYYPLDSEICTKPEVRALWKTLHDNKFINDEKYKRLTSRNEFTEEQKAGFIARQLVETSQATKGIANILKIICKESEIVYSKAGNVSDFRKQFDLIKCRTINDFHHANDAYLNIVVGNAYYVKFTKNPMNFIKNEYAKDHKKYGYHLGKMFEKYDIVRGDEVGWIASSDKNVGTIATVKAVLAKNTPLMTRYNFIDSGAISKGTIYGADKANNKAYIAVKSSDARLLDVKKYGGYTSATTAYFILVESEKKKKKIRTIEAVPIYLVSAIEKDSKELIRFCEDKLELINPVVLISKIKMQSLIKINGYFGYISGKQNSQLKIRNAVNLCLDEFWKKYIHYIEKYNERGFVSDKITENDNDRLYTILMEKFSEKIFLNRPTSVTKILVEGKAKFGSLDIKNQCKVLNEILKLFVIGVTKADLSLINGGKEMGGMVVSKNITDKEVILINQSVTGLFENYIDLLKC